MQDRAIERLQDQIVEEIKELESTKTEEALQIAGENQKEEAKTLQGVTWAPPRNLTKWPDWEARKLENGEWRLEPEGEVEVPDIIIVSDAMEGTPVDLDGESRHEQVEAKLSRRGREMLNEELRSPTRKVIWVESEEHRNM